VKKKKHKSHKDSAIGKSDSKAINEIQRYNRYFLFPTKTGIEKLGLLEYITGTFCFWLSTYKKTLKKNRDQNPKIEQEPYVYYRQQK
jgi:hypothetical protein